MLAALALLPLACVLASSAQAATIEPEATPGPAGLPEGRVYEQVSPSAKHGYQAAPPTRGTGVYGIASPDGSRVLYSSSGPLGEASSGVENFSVSERASTGWSTTAALPAPPPAPRDPVSPSDPLWMLPSTDLTGVSFIARDPFTSVSLDYANPAFSFVSAYLAVRGQPTVWLGAPTAEDPFPALEETENTADMVLAGAAADMRQVYFEYYGTLVPEDAPRRPAVVGGSANVWGLYEWREGRLKAASLLPSGEEDPDGAVAAAVGVQTLGALPSDFDNQVSSNGNVALFVSPDPEAQSGRPPQLYARVDGTHTVLVSRSELTGEQSQTGVDTRTGLSPSHLSSYAFGSPDGSRVFFTSQDQLTSAAPADASYKEYEFDLASEMVTYIPEITAPILASSDDGSTIVFDDTRSPEPQLAIRAGGKVTDIAPLPPPPSPEEQLEVSPVRLAAGGMVVVFQTNSPIPGFNNGEGYGEIYRYDLATNGLSCVSCPPHGQAPTGTANLSNDNLPHATLVVADNHGVTEDGNEVFFDTPDALVGTDTNEKRDVYEWHNGLISQISSGAGTGESIFLDNSASGSDVFFSTNDNLSSTDTDGSYDVYDARVNGGFLAPLVSAGCTTACESGGGQPQAPSLASSGLLGPGEQAAGVQSPGRHAGASSSRAAKLAHSLSACRRKRGRVRRTCERAARKRYGRHPSRGRA